jgi:hypothetical protein
MQVVFREAAEAFEPAPCRRPNVFKIELSKRTLVRELEELVARGNFNSR